MGDLRRMPRRRGPDNLIKVLQRLGGGGIANPPLSTQMEQLEAENNIPSAPSSPCRTHSPIDSIGNVFLLGMTVLISEVIDLTAAKSLEYLLEPCTPKEPDAQEQELADEIGIIDFGIEEGEFIPIAFE